MKLKVIGVVVILASFSIPSQGLPFEDSGLASVVEYEEEPVTELKRDKRTLTTICVEIKPSSPYEEPYFMCKGTDSPKYSKGSNSDSYSAKPSYKPSKPSTYVSGESDSYHSGVKKNNDYHAPSNPEYHAEHSKYDKPTSAYDSAKEYSSPSKPVYSKNPSYSDHGIHHHSDDAYPNYEVPYKPSSYASGTKPSYTDHHDSQDDYTKPHLAHKVTYEKPSAPAYSSKPQTYSHENPSAYDHRQPSAGYSKPSSYESHTAPGGYSKPSSSYEPTDYSKPSSYDHSSSHHDSNPSYNGESHSKPSYGGNDGHSYSAPPETKVLYSKPASYPAKQISYEHADNAQYGQSKPSYNEQPPSKPYSKPSQDYGKPASYGTNEQHSGYAPQHQNYRMMPQDLMQPTWETQPQQLQHDGFGYRSYGGGGAMEYQNLETPRMINHESQLYTGLEGPLRFDLSDADQEAPTLQSPYPHQTYSPPAHQGASYGPVAPSYAPPAHYAPAAPSYPGPVYPSAAPSYVPVSAPSYVPLPLPSPSYAPAAPSYVPTTSSHKSQLPACGQNYMYSFQPVIMSVPCYSLSGGYSSSTYGQALGSPASPRNIPASNINPLQDHSSARSDGNSEPNNKSEDDHSGSQESHESNKKSSPEVETISQTTAKKSENLKKPSDKTDEQHPQVDKNSQDHAIVGAEKPTNEAQTIQTAGVVAPTNNSEVPNTKEAFNAMMKMARIAAQLNKDDAKKGPTDALTASGSPAVPESEKPSGALPQFSRTK